MMSKPSASSVIEAVRAVIDSGKKVGVPTNSHIKLSLTMDEWEALLSATSSTEAEELSDEYHAWQKDAARYRWLRDATNREGSRLFVASYQGGPVAMLGPENADHAIDAAMRSSAPEGKE